jgi:hypothetical protein
MRLENLDTTIFKNSNPKIRATPKILAGAFQEFSLLLYCWAAQVTCPTTRPRMASYSEYELTTIQDATGAPSSPEAPSNTLSVGFKTRLHQLADRLARRKTTIGVTGDEATTEDRWQGEDIHLLSLEELERSLNTDLSDGVSDEEAAKRLIETGYNELSRPSASAQVFRILEYFFGGESFTSRIINTSKIDTEKVSPLSCGLPRYWR